MQMRLAVALAFLAAGVFAAGVFAGRAFDDGSQPDAGAPGPATSLLPNSTPTPPPERPPTLPPEATDWDPCLELGLCEFARRIDDALRDENHEALQGMTRWTYFTCVPPPGIGHEPAREPNGILIWQPQECWDWPYDQPIPALYMGGANSGSGGPRSRWEVRMLWLSLSHPADRCYKNQVRAITKPEFEDGSRFIWVSEPFDCPYDAEGEPGHALRVQRGEDGGWQITSVVYVGSRSHLASDTGYAFRVRYFGP